MKRILTIGSATKDIFITYKKAQNMDLYLDEGRRSFLIFEDGKKVEIEALEYHTGGGATNTAVGLARLGHEVSAFFKIGKDQEGAYVLESLKANHVDARFALVSADVPTATSFVMPTTGGNRVVLVHRGSHVTLSADEIPDEAVRQSDLVYITSLSGQTANLLLPIVQGAKQHGKVVVVNPGTSQMAVGSHILCASMSSIDILTLNAAEACHCMAAMVQSDPELQMRMLQKEHHTQYNSMPSLLKGKLTHQGMCFSLYRFFEEVHAHGVKVVIVTNGKEGVYVSHERRIYFHPSLSVPVVSTLGAGDAFGSGFVGMYTQGYSIQDSIRAGMLNSASVIGHIGAKTGLLTLEYMHVKLQAIIKEMLQEYPIEHNN
jgi:sugar/nucleoside kinase (ribokinase family)